MRGPLTFDLDVDVCVIGAGLAGLTAAREIARRGWSVAVLEARPHRLERLGPQLTASCCRALPSRWSSVVSRVGLDHAKALWALVGDGPRLCAHDHPRDQHAGRRAGRRLAQSLQDRQGRGRPGRPCKLYGQELGAEVEGWPTERVREVLKTDHYFHALHFPRAFHIHPLNYALGLAAAAEAAGARIFEGTPALAIDPDGVRKRIATPHGPRARQPYRARRQRPSRRADAARRRNAAADLDLCDHHRAARAEARGGHRLSRRGERHRSCRQPLPHRRQ